MKTECNTEQLEFHSFGRRKIIGQFDGIKISSDGGGILLREVEKRTGILRRLSQCFTDYRNPEMITHSLESLISQRIMALALGYEDLNDHDALLSVLSGKSNGKMGAGKSTLNRLELTPATGSSSSRYKKIVANSDAMDELLIDFFQKSFSEVPEEIVLDVDATDDLIHGTQQGHFYHGYYRSYCYLPLYIFCGEQLLCARGDMENRIKEQQLALFADRTSCHEMRANQLRLYFSSFAYVLLQTLRRIGLKETELAKAQSETIRLKLLKIGTRIKISVRKIWLSFSESYPYADLLRQVLGNLQKIPIRC